MPEHSTESLLRDLTQELTPVQPIASLRKMTAALLGLFVVAIALSGVFGFPLPGLAAGVPWTSVVFVVLLLGLVGLAAGGLLAGLAGAVPGRSALERNGRRLALAGLGVCAVVSGGWCLAPGATHTEVPLAASLMCLARSAALALLPALAASVYVARAYDNRPRMGAVWTWLGAVALGAAAVHASCSAGGAPHVVLGHIVEPLVLAAVLAALLAPWLRRSARDLARDSAA